MKRSFGLFLLLLILFNTIGYYGVLLLMEHQLSAKILQRIDDNVAGISGDLMLTYPMSLPYSGDSENYERVDGTVVVNGEVYRLVKQKLYHQTLYVICIRDDRSTRILEVMDEYSKTFTNQQPEKSENAVNIVVSFAKYYLSHDFTPQSGTNGWSRSIEFTAARDLYYFVGNDPVFQPPQHPC